MIDSANEFTLEKIFMFKNEINLWFFSMDIDRPDLNGIPYTRIMDMNSQLDEQRENRLQNVQYPEVQSPMRN